MSGLYSRFTNSVVDIDDDEADEVLAALSTDSGRQILTALNDEPATASELADRTDLTAQNVSYHLGKLADAELVRTAGTRGTGDTEATVYVPDKSVVLSTDTDSGYQVASVVVGLVAGLLLSFVCVSSLLGAAVRPLTVVYQLVSVLPPL